MKRVRSLLLLLAGSLLFVTGVAAVALVEGGQGEFGYAPFTPAPLPFSAMRGFTFEQLAAHVVGVLLETPGLFLVWLAVREGSAFARPSERAMRFMALLASSVAVGLIAYFVFFVYRGKAIADDELAYYMQAETLSDGRLGIDNLPNVHEYFTVPSRVGFVAKYLFGESITQIPGRFVGYPALMHIPIAALTLWVFYRAVLLQATREIASWAVVLLACSPMFVMTSATGLSQATSLFCVVTAGLGYCILFQSPRAHAGALLIGMGIGFGLTVRIQVAAPVGVMIGAITTWKLWRVRRFGPWAIMAGVMCAWAGLIAVYNCALTGSPFKLPWCLEMIPEHYGFGQVWLSDRFRHTLQTAFENLAVVIVRYNAWWLGWPSSLLLLWWWYRNGRSTIGARIWLWIGVAVLVFEFGYYSTGISDTGPIYHYELLLPASVLGANALQAGLVRNVRGTLSLLAVQFGLGWTTFFWLQGSRLDRLGRHIHQDVDDVLQRVQPPALVLFEPRCPEATARGWVHDIMPVRYHSSRDPIVTFHRPPIRYLDAYLRQYRDRSCWYFHLNPIDHSPELLRCEQAVSWLRRPLAAEGDQCLWIAPTAARLGWYDPWQAIRARVVQNVDVRAGGPLSAPASHSSR